MNEPDRTRFDDAERILATGAPIELPTQHALALGFYVRQCILPADTVVATKIHGVQHPFYIRRGKVVIVQEDGQRQEITGPYSGVTEPGTRRMIHVLEETEWTTFQPLNDGDLLAMVQAAEGRLMVPNHVEGVPTLNALNQLDDPP